MQNAGGRSPEKNFAVRSQLPPFCRRTFAFCILGFAFSLRYMPHEVKDTLRALVRIGYDGRVTKTFRGPQAAERFANETRVLRHLEARGCPFVPRLLESDPGRCASSRPTAAAGSNTSTPPARGRFSTNCSPYGVRHDDAETRNITYDQRTGRFCVIDFEFATILVPGTRRSRRHAAGPDARPYPCTPTWLERSTPRVCNGPAARTAARCAPTTRTVSFAYGSTRRKCITWASWATLPPPTPISFSRSATAWAARWPASFASRITVEKVTHLLPRAFRQSAVGLETGHADVLEELFDQIHRALMFLGGSDEECEGMGATLSLGWFTGRVDAFRPHRRQPDLLSASARGRPAAGHARRYLRGLALTATASSTNARRARIPGATCCKRRSGRATSSSIRTLAAWPASRATASCCARTGWWTGFSTRRSRSSRSAKPRRKRLVKEALERSGRDNTTALVVEVLPD